MTLLADDRDTVQDLLVLVERLIVKDSRKQRKAEQDALHPGVTEGIRRHFRRQHRKFKKALVARRHRWPVPVQEEWDEELHPRDDVGRFGLSDGIGSSGGSGSKEVPSYGRVGLNGNIYPKDVKVEGEYVKNYGPLGKSAWNPPSGYAPVTYRTWSLEDAQKLHELELSTLQATNEKSAWFSRTGELLGTSQGGRGAVDVPYRLDDGVLSHNHPGSGNPPSPEDVKNAFAMNLAELRVTGMRDGEPTLYALGRPEFGWPKERAFNAELKSQIQERGDEQLAKYDWSVKEPYEQFTQRATTLTLDAAWRAMADKGMFSYRQEPIPNVSVDEALREGWEDQERDDRGRWGSGSGGETSDEDKRGYDYIRGLRDISKGDVEKAVQDSPKWQAQKGFSQRLGRCYELAGRYVMENPTATLVHGSIQGMGNPRLDHAWAETRGGNIYEPITDREWEPKVFDAVFNPKERATYGGHDSLVKMVDTGHFGPWDDKQESLREDDSGGDFSDEDYLDWVEWVDSAWDDISDDGEDYLLEQIEDALSSSARVGVSRAELELEAEVGDLFGIDNPRTTAWLAKNAAERVAWIDEATRDDLRELIASMQEQGASFATLASAIERKFEGYYQPGDERDWGADRPQGHVRDRADLIAQTELAFGYEAGMRMAVDRIVGAGIQIEKSWLSLDDDRVDADCSDNSAEGWMPQDETFQSGDDEPPAHPACRCTTLYRRVGSGVATEVDQQESWEDQERDAQGRWGSGSGGGSSDAKSPLPTRPFGAEGKTAKALAKTFPADMKGAIAPILKAEAATINNKKESVLVVDEFGHVIFEATGSSRSVEMTAAMGKMDDAIATHNHPMNGGPSPDDVLVGIQENAAQIRVVTELSDGSKQLYTVTRPEEGWGSRIGFNLLALPQASNEVNTEVIQLAGKEGMSYKQANQYMADHGWDRTWEKVAKFGTLPFDDGPLILYERTELSPPTRTPAYER